MDAHANAKEDVADATHLRRRISLCEILSYGKSQKSGSVTKGEDRARAKRHLPGVKTWNTKGGLSPCGIK
jgi:hypothetical protein